MFIMYPIPVVKNTTLPLAFYVVLACRVYLTPDFEATRGRSGPLLLLTTPGTAARRWLEEEASWRQMTRFARLMSGME